MPGQSDGICNKNALMASVPPVDAPIINNFSLLISGLRSGAGVLFWATGWRDKVCTLAFDATRILSVISSVYSRMPSVIDILGLVTKSVAPNSSARMVISEPRSVSVETITTGIGRKRIKRSRKSKPSILGISTSSVSTSGLSCLIISRAMSGSGAAPTTSMSFWLLMISVSKLRMSAESSITRTFIFIF